MLEADQPDRDCTYESKRSWLMRAQLECCSCHLMTSVVGLYVEGALELDDGLVRDIECGLLSRITAMDDTTAALLVSVAPSFRPDLSRTLNLAYWINHCEYCGATQGDHFVHPADPAELEDVSYERLHHLVRTHGSVTEVSWGPVDALGTTD